MAHRLRSLSNDNTSPAFHVISSGQSNSSDTGLSSLRIYCCNTCGIVSRFFASDVNITCRQCGENLRVQPSPTLSLPNNRTSSSSSSPKRTRSVRRRNVSNTNVLPPTQFDLMNTSSSSVEPTNRNNFSLASFSQMNERRQGSNSTINVDDDRRNNVGLQPTGQRRVGRTGRRRITSNVEIDDNIAGEDISIQRFILQLFDPVQVGLIQFPPHVGDNIEFAISASLHSYRETSAPVKKSFVESLKEVVILEEQKDDENTCSICLTPWEEGNVSITLDCNHNFHSQCIKKWFEEKNTCPICRHKFPKEEE